MPDSFAGDRRVRFFARSNLHGKVANRGAFRVTTIDGKPCMPRCEIGEKPIAAGASDDVDAIKLSVEYLFEMGEGSGVANGKAFKDKAREERLVAGNVGDRLMPGGSDLFVDAGRHVAGEE